MLSSQGNRFLLKSHRILILRMTDLTGDFHRKVSARCKLNFLPKSSDVVIDRTKYLGGKNQSQLKMS